MQFYSFENISKIGNLNKKRRRHTMTRLFTLQLNNSDHKVNLPQQLMDADISQFH